MSEFSVKVQAMIAAGAYDISQHAFGKFDRERVVFEDILSGMADAVVVEEYPDYHKGPSVLVKIADRDGTAVHALWGIPKGTEGPVYLVTAYRPAPDRWSSDFLERKPK